MKKYIKMGFGLTVGCYLGRAVLDTIEEFILMKAANDEKFMEWLNEKDHKFYEQLKKRFT